MNIRTFLCLLPAAVLTFCSCRTVPQNPVLQSGKIMFWGDSITDKQMYPSYFEAFYRTRFPEGNAVFVERGWSGDRMGNLARVRRDGMPEKADLIYVMYGMNDAEYNDGDVAASMKTFRKNLLASIKLFREANPSCRFVLMSSPAMEVFAQQQMEYYPWVLRSHAREMEKLAHELGIPYIDQNLLYSGFSGAAANMFPPDQLSGKHPSSELQPFRLTRDGIHPTRAGQAVLAMNMFPEVPDLSVIEYDHRTGILTARGSNLTPLAVSPDRSRISFTRQLQRLPFALPPDVAFMEPLLLLSEKINRDLFYARNLQAGTWRLAIDGEPYWDFSAEDLAEGVNLSEFGSSPDMLQSRKVMKFVEIKNREERKAWMRRLNGDTVRKPSPGARWKSMDDPEYVQRQYEIEARTRAIKFHSQSFYHEISLQFMPDTPARPWRSRFQRSMPMALSMEMISPAGTEPEYVLKVKVRNSTGKDQNLECYMKLGEELKFLKKARIKTGEERCLRIPMTAGDRDPRAVFQAYYQPEDRSFPRMCLKMPVSPAE